MFHSLPNPEPQISFEERRNPWAIVDVVVFGLFFIGMLVLIAPLARLPVIYAIPLQGLFNLTLVGFIAFWIRVVRRNSFSEYIHLRPNWTFSLKSLVLLGAMSALAVLFISAFLPSTGETPLEKLLTSRSAILMFAVFGVAFAPILEEIIFRGFLFKALWEIGGSRAAIPITAALFAILHSPQLAGNWPSVALIFVVGCMLSVVRHQANSIIPSFIVHTSYNGVLFVLFAINSVVQKILK
jgi:membrane protease YdiL (CAAX protease family)